MLLSGSLFAILAGPVSGRLKPPVEQAQVELLEEVLADPALRDHLCLHLCTCVRDPKPCRRSRRNKMENYEVNNFTTCGGGGGGGYCHPRRLIISK